MEKAQGVNRLSLCWKCKNTNRFDCSWFDPDNPQPVPGWEAELIPKHRMEETYLVKACPKFDPETPRGPTPTKREKPEVRGLFPQGNSWVAVIRHKKKKYYLGSFPTYEEAAQARLAAEDAIKRGEEPQPHPPRPRGRPVRQDAARSSSCPGVYFRKREGHWVARACYQGKVTHLGYFKTEEEAIAARKAAEASIRRGMAPRASRRRLSK